MLCLKQMPGDNPFQDPLRFDRRVEPCMAVIYGANGDLTKRKLVPALYRLAYERRLPPGFAVIGISRTKLTDDEFRAKMRESVQQFLEDSPFDEAMWEEFARGLFYEAGDVGDPASFVHLGARIQAVQAERNTGGNVLFYLSTQPSQYALAAAGLGSAGLNREDKGWRRLIIEKPFGHDQQSAKELEVALHEHFAEHQLYRIDHYLGKETVQNIMAFRFANSILEPIWNRNYIQHVQISVLEKLGVEERAEYYEGAGAMRDMMQNHLLQLLCFIAMETPINFDADEVRNRKVDVLRAMRKFSAEDIRTFAVRGQYGSGWMEGKEVPGYREEHNVNPESNTETFAAVKLFIDNWRWHDVPFYLRSGKRMHQTASTISIQFRDVPHFVFPPEATDNWQQNRLIINIQPEMNIRLQLQAKKPGLDMLLNTIEMVFNYDGKDINETPEAYETLLLEIMMADQTLFMRADHVEAAWELLMPILNSWQTKKSVNFPNYAADSTGPETAEALIARDGFHWFSLPLTHKK